MYHLLKGPILRLSVSFDDHSHLIGRQGLSHQNLQAITKTLIHFPERKVRSKTTQTCVPPSFQGEDEVLITPTELELKKEPCSPEMEDRLLELFSSSVQRIRMNQLLIIKIPFQCSPSLFCEIQQAVHEIVDVTRMKASGIYLSYSGFPEEPIRELVIRGTVSNSQLIVSAANRIRDCLSNRFKLPVSKLTSTTRIPFSKWNSIVAKVSDDICKSYGINVSGQLTASCVLDMYLRSIETDVTFDGKSLVVISAHDPRHILEVKSMLVGALPVSILIASNTVACTLDNGTVNLLEAFYSVKIGGNIGNATGDSTTAFFGASAKRFFVGQKMALESNGSIAPLLEVKWLLSQSNLPYLLTTWLKMRKLWEKKYPTINFPACLQSPKKFIQMEDRSNLIYSTDSPVPVHEAFNNTPAVAIEVRPRRMPLYNAAPGISSAAFHNPHAAAPAVGGPAQHRRTNDDQLRSVFASALGRLTSWAPATATPVTVSSAAYTAAPAAILAETSATLSTREIRPAASPFVRMPDAAVTAPMLEPGTIAASPWVSPSSEESYFAWLWQQEPQDAGDAPRGGAERSRDASASSEVFGSSPDSNAWNRRRDSTGEGQPSLAEATVSMPGNDNASAVNVAIDVAK